jgi:hypothetical protein
MAASSLTMRNRFPGYDVLTKRAGLSWNDATRRAIDAPLPWRVIQAFSRTRNGQSGTRVAPMPWDGEAWQLALRALDA